MNRLQKKCFIASTGLHLLLLLILIIGPAFLSSESKKAEIVPIDFIPPNIIEANFAGGGTPNTRPPPPAPVEPHPTPVAPPPDSAPPPPKPAPVKPAEPDPPKEVVKPPKPTPESLELTKENKKPKIEIVTKAVSRNADSQKKPKQKPDPDSRDQEIAEAKAQETRDKKRRAAAAAMLADASQALRNDTSPATKININPGPGGGGPAYAGYEQVLQRIYQGRYDEAMAIAGDLGDSHATVEVAVTVQRSGTVTSSRIVSPSGISGMDRLVKGVLNRVNSLPPFPEAAKDSERTFNILFELKSKRGTG